MRSQLEVDITIALVIVSTVMDDSTIASDLKKNIAALQELSDRRLKEIQRMDKRCADLRAENIQLREIIKAFMDPNISPEQTVRAFEKAEKLIEEAA